MNDITQRLIENERKGLDRDVQALLSNIDDLKLVHAKRPLSMMYVNSVQLSLDDIKRRIMRIEAWEEAS